MGCYPVIIIDLHGVYYAVNAMQVNDEVLMSTLQKIEQDIQTLPENQVAELQAWLDDYNASLWDRQIQKDAKSGKLDALMNQAKADFKAGKCREL